MKGVHFFSFQTIVYIAIQHKNNIWSFIYSFMFYHQFIKQKKPSRTLLQQLYTQYSLQ